jgi:integrase
MLYIEDSTGDTNEEEKQVREKPAKVIRRKLLKGEQRNLKFRKGRWLVDYSTKRPEKPFDGREAALLYLHRVRDQKQLSRVGIELPENGVTKPAPTIDDFSERVITSHSNGRGLRANTERGYRTIRKAVLTIFKGRPINSITAEELDAYRAKRAESIKPPSLNLELVFLKMIFKKALEWDFIKTNPALSLRLARLERKSIHVLTREEAVRLVEVASPRLRPILQVLLQTGIRKGEALALRWAYKSWETTNRAESVVDLEGRKIVVKAALAKSHRERSIPISD